MVSARKYKVHPLKGRYCSDCVRSLTRINLKKGSIFPMCAEDLHQFLTNGDYKICNRLIDNPANQK